MTCQFCGTQLCQCLNQGMNQAQLQNQMAQQAGYMNSHNQQMAMQRAQGFPAYTEPTPEEKFLNLIDGKSDEEIVIAFETLMMDEKKTNETLIAKIKENHEQSQAMKRDNFMAMCKRFRPSINEEFIKRICGMKAFW